MQADKLPSGLGLPALTEPGDRAESFRLLVLASASPRRRELLALLGVPFEVLVSGVDEEAFAIGSPADVAARLARAKAEDVAERLSREPLAADHEHVVLGADTVVAVEAGGETLLLAKPADAPDTRRMLGLLSCRPHRVVTGVAVAVVPTASHEVTRAVVVDSVETVVTFRGLSPAEIAAYAATPEPNDKAGGYAIQGGASAFVQSVRGDYYNVIGLPLGRVRELLLPLIPDLLPPPDPVVTFAIEP